MRRSLFCANCRLCGGHPLCMRGLARPTSRFCRLAFACGGQSPPNSSPLLASAFMWGETPHTPHVFARPPALFAVPRGTVLCQEATPHSRGMSVLFSESLGVLCTKDAMPSWVTTPPFGQRLSCWGHPLLFPPTLPVARVVSPSARRCAGAQRKGWVGGQKGKGVWGALPPTCKALAKGAV